MKYRPRIYYTETDKALIWDRWQKGDSLHSIARLFDRSHGLDCGHSRSALSGAQISAAPIISCS